MTSPLPSGQLVQLLPADLRVGGRRVRATVRTATAWEITSLDPAPPLIGAAAPTVLALEQLEAGLGRPLDLWRTYRQPGDTTLIGPKEQAALTGGRRLHTSFNLPWVDVAAGKLDATLDQLAASVLPYATDVDLTFCHEPETYPQGSPAQFAAATVHTIERFRAAGVASRWILTLQAWSFHTAPGSRACAADAYYPGDGLIDLVGADGYSWAHTNRKGAKPTPAADIFGPAADWCALHRYPLCVPEIGAAEDPEDPTERAAWITAAWPALTHLGVEQACWFQAADKAKAAAWPIAPGSPAMEALRAAAAA